MGESLRRQISRPGIAQRRITAKLARLPKPNGAVTLCQILGGIRPPLLDTSKPMRQRRGDPSVAEVGWAKML
jgi:hypothetical protein